MNLWKVVFVFFVLVFFLIFGEVLCISNSRHEQNLIGEEDKRAADSFGKTEQLKSERGVYEAQGTHNRHQVYPSGYDSTYAHPTHTYGQGLSTAYYPGHSSYGNTDKGHYGLTGVTGHESYGLTGHGVSYGHSGHELSYGHTGHGVSYGHQESHKFGGLGLKGLLIPLAGIALLGAAAALSTNPVLLQLGVLNGRRRRRRSPNLDAYPTNPYLNPNEK